MSGSLDADSRGQAPTLERLRARRQEILRIAAARGARNVRVVGSVARGEAQPGSDIDLLVELDDDRDVLDLSGLILDLEEALGRSVDVLELPPASLIAPSILRDAVDL